jgi:hypothetical protein
MLITVAVLALYAALACWQMVAFHIWIEAAFALVAAVAAVSAALMRPWSRYPVYLLSIALTAFWIVSIRTSYARGYFRTYPLAHVLASLLPETLLVLLLGYCSYAVYRQFQR